MVSSETEIISEVRKELGLSNHIHVPNSVIENNLEEAENWISSDIRNRIGIENKIVFYEVECANYALKNYLLLSTKLDIDGNEGKKPKSINRLRRTDFSDSQLNYWKNQCIKNIREVCNE